MTRVSINRNFAVRCEAELEVPLPAETVWGRLRDFQRFASHDFFHANIRIDGTTPRAGAALTMEHRFLIFTRRRIGRIVWWREGVGFSYSDLSTGGPRRGFPHIFSYRIRARPREHSILHISVRGRWTSQKIPRVAATLWLYWVFLYIVTNVRNEMLLSQVVRRPISLL